VRVEDPIVSDRVVADPTPEVQEEPGLAWGRTILVESARDGFTVLLNRHVTSSNGGQSRDLALKSVYAPAHTVTLVGTRGAPSAEAVAAAVDQLRGSQRVLAVLPRGGRSQALEVRPCRPNFFQQTGPRNAAITSKRAFHRVFGRVPRPRSQGRRRCVPACSRSGSGPITSRLAS
jgi:hypothetical protein